MRGATAPARLPAAPTEPRTICPPPTPDNLSAPPDNLSAPGGDNLSARFTSTSTTTCGAPAESAAQEPKQPPTGQAPTAQPNLGEPLLQDMVRATVNQAYREVYGYGMPSTWHAAIRDDFKVGSGDLWANVDAAALRGAAELAKRRRRDLGPWAIRRHVANLREKQLAGQRRRQEIDEAKQRQQAEDAEAVRARAVTNAPFEGLDGEAQGRFRDQARLELRRIRNPQHGLIDTRAAQLAWTARQEEEAPL